MAAEDRQAAPRREPTATRPLAHRQRAATQETTADHHIAGSPTSVRNPLAPHPRVKCRDPAARSQSAAHRRATAHPKAHHRTPARQASTLNPQPGAHQRTAEWRKPAARREFAASDQPAAHRPAVAHPQSADEVAGSGGFPPSRQCARREQVGECPETAVRLESAANGWPAVRTPVLVHLETAAHHPGSASRGLVRRRQPVRRPQANRRREAAEGRAAAQHWPSVTKHRPMKSRGLPVNCRPEKNSGMALSHRAWRSTSVAVSHSVAMGETPRLDEQHNWPQQASARSRAGARRGVEVWW